MVHKHTSDDDHIDPAYAGRLSHVPVPKNRLPEEMASADAVFEVLYLGGNADLYVLVDPCNDDSVELVSVGSTRLVVIDEITCSGA